jgi:uncharacterized lipoprotein YbaY
MRPRPSFSQLSTASLFAALLLLNVSSAQAQYPGAKKAPGAWKDGFQSIKIEDAKELVGVLAGPDFQGRSASTPNFAAAAGYAAAFFRQNGIQPAGENGGYFQRFTLQSVWVQPESAAFESADGSLKLEWSKDFGLSALADFETKVKLAFVRVPKGKDLSGLDLERLRGKIVILSSADMRSDTPGTPPLTQRLAPAETGALQTITPLTSQNMPVTASPQTAIKELSPPTDAPPFTFLRLRADAADRLAEKCGATNYRNADATEVSIEESTEEFTVRGKVERADQFQTLNVVVKIEGSDPVLKNEAVVIGAHLDHMGVSPRGGTRFGADDNASGCTAAMMIARALQKNKVKPKRTIIIGLWSCEELGLWGSLYYANRPVIPLKQTVAYLNMDMVGRNVDYVPYKEKAADNETSIYVGSARNNSPDLHLLMLNVNQYIGLQLKEEPEDRINRSDTRNFYQNGVPTLKAWTGEHPDYHQVGDTPDKINYEKLTNVAKWIYLATAELATSDAKPGYVKQAARLTGTIALPSRVPLTPESVVEVTLADVSRGEKNAVVVSRQLVTRPGASPVPFSVAYDPARINNDARYAVQIRVLEKKKTRFEDKNAAPVLTQGNLAGNIVINLDKITGE